MDKNVFENPEMEFIVLEEQNIICTSSAATFTPPDIIPMGDDPWIHGGE